MKITADLKCLACGRVWATTQASEQTPFAASDVRSARPEILPELNRKTKRCPRCTGTLMLEMTEAEEYETDQLIGA